LSPAASSSIARCGRRAPPGPGPGGPRRRLRRLPHSLWRDHRRPGVEAQYRSTVSSSIPDNDVPHTAWAVPLMVTIGRLIEEMNESDEFNKRNPYVQREEYRPPAREMQSFEPAEVQGMLPEDMDGLYVWNCPIPNTWPPTHTYTNLDGHGMLYCLRIRNGKADASSHILRTPIVKYERLAKFDIWGRPGDLRSLPGLMKLALSKFLYAPLLGISTDQVGSANTNLLRFEDRWFALEETMSPYEFDIDPETGKFQSMGFHDPGQGGSWTVPMSAHPKLDRRKGDLMVTGYKPSFPSAVIQYGVFRDGKLKSSFQFRLKGPDAPMIPFMHDMAITEDYSIVIDNSFEFVFPLNAKGTGEILRFNEKRSAKLGVIPRFATSGDDIVWFDMGEPLVCNHVANAWQDPNDADIIVLHSPVATEGIDVFEHIGYFGRMTEFRLNLRTRTFEKTDYSHGRSSEFPRVKDDLVGYPTQYAYSVKHAEDRKSMGGLLKWDMFNRQIVDEVEFGEGFLGIVGEPQFVPRIDAQNEDDGYIISAVMHPDKSTRLHIYDAKQLHDGPMATLTPGEKIPFGLHGTWASTGTTSSDTRQL